MIQDVGIYDTSSFFEIEERNERRVVNKLLDISMFIQPVELNPLKDKLNFLNQFSKVKSNWDGFGGKIPNDKTIENAKCFLGLLPSYYQKMLNIDEVSITPYGTIVLEWYKNENNYISIEIGNSKIGFFSETPDGENPLEQSLEFTSYEVPTSVIPVFSKVFSA